MPKMTKTKKPSAGTGLTLLGSGTSPLPANPGLARLEVFANQNHDRDYEIQFDCPEFTALCPITGQPDFGHITIIYVPDKWCLESKSLKLYLGSFRNHGTFHEAVVNRVRDDIAAALKPRRLVVTGRFRPRGGISIRVTAEYVGS